MPTLRTTIEPEREITVPDEEALHLERLGLVVHTQATTDAGARRAAANQAAAPPDTRPARVRPSRAKQKPAQTNAQPTSEAQSGTTTTKEQGK